MANILITGGCGFVGSNLVDLLVQDPENRVHVIDNLSRGNKDYINEKASYFFGDIRNILTPEWGDPLSGVHPGNATTYDVIYHCAALARIQPSFNNPLEVMSVNSQGTAVVCEYARRSNASIVYAGSSSFYAGQYLNPYAFSKWSGEQVCRMYHEIYGLDIDIARFFNVYGVRHPGNGPYATVIGIFESQYRSNATLTITGDGEQRRDFTHINDICSGLIAIHEKGQHKSTIYNLGRASNYSINELAAMYETDTTYIDARPGEARDTLADISLIQNDTGWSPTHNLEDYVSQWIEENKSWIIPAPVL